MLLAQAFQGICRLFDKALEFGFLLFQCHALLGKAVLLLLQIRQTLADIQRQGVIICSQRLPCAIFIVVDLLHQLASTALIQLLLRHQPGQLSASIPQRLLGFIQLLIQQQHVVGINDLLNTHASLPAHQGFHFGPCSSHVFSPF